MSGALITEEILPVPESDKHFGQQQPASSQHPYNELQFVIAQMLGRIETVMPVKVQACTNSGGISPVGFVDVVPLVNQTDGKGRSVEHGTVYHLPYFRVQGGINAVIIDPQPGDIGMAAICSRDVSAVKASKGKANPGSKRRFSFADGMYFGGFLNGTPTQYVQFSSTGITIHSPTKIRLDAPLIELDGYLMQTNTSHGTGETHLIGPVYVTNDVTAENVSLKHHTHNGVQPGGGNTGQPNAS